MLDELDDKPVESLNWRAYLRVMKRRRLHFVLPFFVLWAVVWGLSWLLPSIYRSTTVILVEQPSVPSQYVVPNISGDLQDRLQTMSQQILSRTRLLNIIERLNLYSKERKNKTADEVVDRMRRDIEIELVRSPGRDSVTSFSISFSSRKPQQAQRVTSELTRLYINENLEARQEQSQNTTKFLEKQLEEARRALAEQEEKIRQYKDQHLGELPGQLQSNLQILGGLQDQLRTEQEALNRVQQQNAYLQSLTGQYLELRRSSPSSIVSERSPSEQELDRLRNQLIDLRARYTDGHPDVAKLRGQVAMKQQQVAEEQRHTGSAKSENPEGMGVSGAVPRGSTQGELQGQLKVNELEIASRKRSIAGLQGRINLYQERLNQAPIREQQLADLTRGYDQSKENYDSLLAKKNSSELATNLEVEQKSEHFRILDPPSLPVKPSSPNRRKLCAIGLFLGLLVGTAFVIGSEFLDDRIFEEEALQRLLPTTILTDIPKIATEDELRRARAADRFQWFATAIVFCFVLAGSALTILRG